jgi:hypothetical protein
MSRCFFADAPPRVEVRGDLIFIIPENCGCEIALTAHTLRRFIAVANEALAKWQVAQLDKVVEFPGQH